MALTIVDHGTGTNGDVTKQVYQVTVAPVLNGGLESSTPAGLNIGGVEIANGDLVLLDASQAAQYNSFLTAVSANALANYANGSSNATLHVQSTGF